MNTIIKSIALDSSFELYNMVDIKDKPTGNVLDNLSKINIFVGANNSGKSRFMRQLSYTERLEFLPSLPIDKIEDIKFKMHDGLNSFAGRKQYQITDASVSSIGKKYCYFTEGNPMFSDIDDVVGKILRQQGFSVERGNVGSKMDIRDMERLAEHLKPIIDEYSSIISTLPKNLNFKKLYIPSLRGLRSFSLKTEGQSSKDIYKIRTESDYFNDKKVKPDIFTGLGLYDTVRNLLLGDLRERDVIKRFQDFLSENFFDGKQVALIPRKDSDVLVVKIGSEPEFPIHQLGDGIQSIITLIFPLFEKKDENYLVFIEEPEIYMHPGLQRIFINTLFHFKKHQFFFTTHSNHFLDLTLDYEHISIYTFDKRSDKLKEEVVSSHFEVRNVSNESNNTLELLGVRNSSVLLTNCTIWVEGITDRRYLTHYLRKYMDKLKSEDGEKIFKAREDVHYSFVEYSGANITHWSFLEADNCINVDRLCGRLFLIADRDDPTEEAKKIRHEKLKLKLKERFYLLPVREVENLLTPNVLKEVIKKYEKEPPSFPDFKLDDYTNEPLGNFIEVTILNGKKTRAGTYAEKSGTISQKIDFCVKALSKIKSFDDMSSEAQELTKLIYEFIKKLNP
jgi:hypothetical protein